MNPNVEKTVSLIPEFYYDIIARIIPGLIAYVGFSYTWQGSLSQPGTFLESITLLVLCYVLGLSMDRIGVLYTQGKQRKTFESVMDGMASVKKSHNLNVLAKMYAELVLLNSLFTTTCVMTAFWVIAKVFRNLPQHLNSHIILLLFSLTLFYFLSKNSVILLNLRLKKIHIAESMISNTADRETI